MLIRKRYREAINHPLIEFVMRSIYCIPPIEHPNFITPVSYTHLDVYKRQEILPGKTIREALNTDLVCDAINTAMRELFLQIVYGRTQSAFSEGGLIIGAGLEMCIRDSSYIQVRH